MNMSVKRRTRNKLKITPFAIAGIFAISSFVSYFAFIQPTEAADVEAPTYAPINLVATNITDDGATLSWEPNPSQPNPELIQYYQFSATKVGGVIAFVGGSTSDLSYVFTPGALQPGRDYVFTIAATNGGGVGPLASVTFTTTGEAPQQGTFFGEEDGKKVLIITGEGFLEDENQFTEALSRSMVRLNGDDLSFCSAGIGMTSAQAIAAFSGSFPNIANLVTDNPPCYFLYETNGNVALTPTSAKIWLPDNFDFDAPGSVVINGDVTYEFNTGESGTPTIQPTILADGSAPTVGRLALSKRPTFTGVATPGAQVVVTVRSDPVTCTATADSQGNWSCTLPTELPAGSHTLYVTVTNPDNSVVNLGPYPITVDGQVVLVGSATKSAAVTQRIARGTTTEAQAVTVTDEVALNEVEDQDVAQTDDDQITKTTDTRDVVSDNEQSNGWGWVWFAGGIILLAGIVTLIAVNRKRSI